MAEALARLTYTRIAPRNARLVADAIRGKSVEEARMILRTSPKKGARLIKKLLDSAVANAEQKKNMDIANLYVKKIIVDGGTSLVRFKPRAMGRATIIRRRTSHIEIVLAEK
jgi:large subunit ribosomal protein L22